MLGAELPKLLRKHRTFCPASIRSIPVPNLGDLLDPNPLAPDLNLVQGAQGHGFHGIRLVLLPRIPGPGDANPLSNMMHQGGLRHFFGGMYGNSTHQKGMSQPGLFALNILGKMFQDPLRLTKGCSSSRCTTVGRSEKQPRAQQDATGTPQPKRTQPAQGRIAASMSWRQVATGRGNLSRSNPLLPAKPGPAPQRPSESSDS